MTLTNVDFFVEKHSQKINQIGISPQYLIVNSAGFKKNKPKPKINKHATFGVIYVW